MLHNPTVGGGRNSNSSSNAGGAAPAWTTAGVTTKASGSSVGGDRNRRASSQSNTATSSRFDSSCSSGGGSFDVTGVMRGHMGAGGHAHMTVATSSHAAHAAYHATHSSNAHGHATSRQSGKSPEILKSEIMFLRRTFRNFRDSVTAQLEEQRVCNNYTSRYMIFVHAAPTAFIVVLIQLDFQDSMVS